MNSYLQKFIKVCPKSGRIRKIIIPSGFYRILLPVIGLAALLWIVIRVIPKPSRANYPCVKAAAPFASGFVIYFSSLIISTLAFLKTKKRIYLTPYIISVGFAFTGFTDTNSIPSGAPGNPLPNSVHVANSPTGDAKGIFPGRVVWVYDPAATNENCVPSAVDHAYWMAENNDQTVIDGMVSKAIKSLTGKTNDKDAWDAIFEYHNNTRGKGSVRYKAGEKIFIKINNVSGWGGNYNTQDLSVTANSFYGISETSPQIILTVLRQLVNVVGVAQGDIYIGDPLRNIYKHSYELWHNEFPDVHYLSNGNYTRLGRERVVASSTAQVIFSDKGTILKENVWDTNRPGGAPVSQDYLYTIFEEAEYILNIPIMKGHKRAGMTMFAKNHFGSHTRADASHLHMGLVDPIEIEHNLSRRDYGQYRVQVDLMGHKLLGGKTLFYLMDALWPADQEISFPKKFSTPPFNNDFFSSVFASFDPVAIESVGYDFLRTEFTASRTISDGAGTYAQKPAADDYLHQASDTTLWAEGIKYDPENDGINLNSLGVHEHWNNQNDKQYTRDLGTGNGIELMKVMSSTSVEEELSAPVSFELAQNYPNPFNPSTTITYSLPKAGYVTLKVYNELGKEIAVLVKGYMPASVHNAVFNASGLASGIYFCKLTAGGSTLTRKMVLLK